MIGFRTKLEALGLVLLLVCMSIISVVGVTRTISDTGDTVDTYIRNSKGNYWEATGANLQLAINDLATVGGTVWVGNNITLTSTIKINKSYVTVDFQEHLITLGADISFVNFSKNAVVEGGSGVVRSSIKNFRVSVYDGQTKPIILFYIRGAGATNIWADRIIYCNVEHGSISNSYTTKYNFTGIYLHVNGYSNFVFNTFDDIRMSYVGTGIHLNNTDNDHGYGNSNYFNNIYLDCYETGIKFNIAEVALNGWSFDYNVFSNIRMETGPYTKYGIREISGSGNIFDHVFVWDWNAASAGVYQWWLASLAYDTQIYAENSYRVYMKDDAGNTHRNVISYLATTMGTYDLLYKGYNITIYGKLQIPITSTAYPVAGTMWFNTSTGKLGIYSGTAWYWK